MTYGTEPYIIWTINQKFQKPEIISKEVYNKLLGQLVVQKTLKRQV